MEINSQEAHYVISVAARIVGVHTQTLRYYERNGLISPSRSEGRRRLYSLAEIEKLKRIKRLTDDLGINLAGVEVIMRLMTHIGELEQKMQQLEKQLSLCEGEEESKFPLP